MQTNSYDSDSDLDSDLDSDSDLNSAVSAISISLCSYDSDDSINSDELLWPSPSHYDINDDEDSFELITKDANSNIQNELDTKPPCDR